MRKRAETARFVMYMYVSGCVEGKKRIERERGIRFDPGGVIREKYGPEYIMNRTGKGENENNTVNSSVAII